MSGPKTRQWLQARLRWAVMVELGTGRTAFQVYLGERRATEQIGSDYEFDPAGRVPAPIF